MALKRNRPALLLLFFLLLPPPAFARVGTFPEKGVSLSLRPTRYNRVEGLFIGAETVIAPMQWKGVGLFGAGGYGRASGEWRYEAGLQFRRGDANLSASTFNRTASLDDSLIATGANTFTALFAKRDYKDYFQAKDGIEVSAHHRYRKTYIFGARVAFSTLQNMPVATHWSLFRRDDPFRDNPRISEGREGFISVSVALDKTAPNPLLRSGTRLSVAYERRFRDFEGDGLTLAGTRYQVMPFGRQTLVLRGILTSRTRLAPQDSLRLLYIGGLGTLRGYTFREFHGNRMLLLNADYVFQNALRFVDLVLFFDTGWTGRRPPSASLLSGFSDAQWSDFKSDLGVSLALGQQARLDVARRLDRRRADWVLTIQGRRRF
ncbi:MAG: hypothetical protein A3F84_05445 [Candidatus Handelsmanbacteria bacterium RIFCSPLOWO2_12_FULL_64_10]|uniref:Bacterial surface antigen (D15) domain-containing protein n=1 Tax=Handelsmanbacteria sp. (strain RIFCSPLOWO2_12_FULL_64_10) TaxID=1817868 RepID=A0A1F6CUL3_HANXR|nr:MAG: hypothetical protein A3F84_05445 [Candidatus Handelsmanbacteria bacterium RIFCSPLOWO2_12_FULL_64_10]